MRTIVQSLAVEYVDEGKGPTILMLHGWKDSLHTFDQLVPYFTNQFRIIRLDLPGFGGSDMPKGVWDIGAYVGFVILGANTLRSSLTTATNVSLSAPAVK